MFHSIFGHLSQCDQLKCEIFFFSPYIHLNLSLLQLVTIVSIFSVCRSLKSLTPSSP